ncbi:hypothetical protein [Chloroflexus aggregans]|uniref:Uncharacterized protein n=1 Tax=Chloroflexus aggregans (strain MD-66 / DSM 9485) TaxID=326427 RepID=B8G8Y7_CHLAD|nr:hypothetical protein [Chloroflexus aggregans]ACL26262.1 hypothetical protein Cagg_3420 [Chloroflexus aggregans DSM 9485]
MSELRQIIDVLYPVQLDSPWLISAKPVPVGDFEWGALQLYRYAKQEGIYGVMSDRNQEVFAYLEREEQSILATNELFSKGFYDFAAP